MNILCSEARSSEAATADAEDREGNSLVWKDSLSSQYDLQGGNFELKLSNGNADGIEVDRQTMLEKLDEGVDGQLTGHVDT